MWRGGLHHPLWSKQIQKYANDLIPNERPTSTNGTQPNQTTSTPTVPTLQGFVPGLGGVFFPFHPSMATNIPVRSFRPPFSNQRACRGRGGGSSYVQGMPRAQFRPVSSLHEQQAATSRASQECSSSSKNSAGSGSCWKGKPGGEHGANRFPPRSDDSRTGSARSRQDRSNPPTGTSSVNSEEGPSARADEMKAQFKSSQDVGRYFFQRYKQTQRGKKQRAGLVEFSIVSYNILAASLAESNMSLYSECSQSVLDWSYRKRNLLKEIRHLSSDIVCLQEVDASDYDRWFLPELKKTGYSGSFMKRTGNKSDGCATFYKTKTFELVAEHLISFNKPGVPLMDRDNVAIVLLLKPKRLTNSGSLLCIANTHLLFNKKRGDIKLVQLSYLLAEIDKVSRKADSDSSSSAVGHHPVLLCGDLNSLPHSPLYKFVTKGYIHYGGMFPYVISGQIKGEHHRGTRISSALLPEALGISSQCKYVEKDVAEDKEKETGQGHPRSGRRLEKSHLECGLDVLDMLQSEQEIPGTSGNSKLPGSSIAVAGTSATVPCTTAAGPCTRAAFPGTSAAVPGTSTDPLQGGKDKSSKLEFTHNFHFQSAYRHFLPNGEHEVTTKHECTSCTVDYIFYSNPGPIRHPRHRSSQPTEAGTLQLQKTLNLLSDENLVNLGGLPNIKLSSDHLALQAFFSLS